MFGDQTLIKLHQAFLNAINSQGIGLSKANTQCDEFDKTLST